MKRLPSLLAIGFVLITFVRVSDFLRHGMQLGWLGVSFAIALTGGVYVSAYFTQFKETRWAATAALIPFAIADVSFNTLEMVRTLSPETLVAAQANFLNWNSESIERGLQMASIAYGVLPTLFAGLLGWLQADAEKVASLNKRGFIATILLATKATLQKGIKATLEDWFGKEHFAQLSSGNSGKSLTVSDDTVIDATELSAKVRWEDLVAANKTEIAGMSTRQIVAKWGVGERTARNWKTRVQAGE